MRLGAILVAVIATLAVLPAGQRRETLAQTEGVSRGKALYQQVCMQCHGFDGKGTSAVKLNPPPADLTSQKVQNKLDAGLFKSIHEGRKNTAMGAWKHALSDEQIYDVIAYVRILGTGAGVAKP